MAVTRDDIAHSLSNVVGLEIFDLAQYGGEALSYALPVAEQLGVHTTELNDRGAQVPLSVLLQQRPGEGGHAEIELVALQPGVGGGRTN